MIAIFDWMRKRKLLVQCTVASLCVHIGVLFYFYNHPLILSSSWNSLFGLSFADPEWLAPDEDQEFSEKNNLALQEAFAHIVLPSSHLQAPVDFPEQSQGLCLAPRAEASSLSDISLEVQHVWEPSIEHRSSPVLDDSLVLEDPFIHALAFPDQEIAYDQTDPTTFQMERPTSKEFPIALEEDWFPNNLPQATDFIALGSYEEGPLPVLEQNEALFHDSLLASSEMSQPRLALKKDSHLLMEHADFTPLQLKEEPVAGFRMAPKTPSLTSVLPASMTRPLQIEDYAFPSIATAVEWSDEFDAQLHFMTLEDKKGYAFAIELQPKLDLSQYSLKQNIHFIIDRSHSIQKHRFSVFKRAVLKALSSMQESDTFNIYVIDKKISKFSSAPTRLNKKSIDAAEVFLEKQEGNSLFAEANICQSLDKILPETQTSHEVHTAVLLTDGHSLSTLSKQHKELQKWIDKNSGRLSVYTAAVGQKNHYLMLDLLSAISGGRFLYSDTHASFPRKLAKLVLDLRNPVAKDLMIVAQPHRSHARVEFYPSSTHLPLLHGHQPYTIYGYIDEPCNFDLIVQGRNSNEWVTIKKTISFLKGAKSSPQFEKQWRASQADLYYTRFVKEGKADLLDKAKAILKASHQEIAFD